MGKALSDRIKTQRKHRIKNWILSDALEEYTREQGKPDGEKRLSARAVAEKHGLKSHKTLISHYKGQQTMSAFNEAKQKLTPAEEAVLMGFLLESADHGPLATERARALNPENVKSWFELVEKWLDIYGMDKSGFPPSDQGRRKPTIIFKAKKFQSSWQQNNVSGASFCHSENGWTDGEIAMSCSHYMSKILNYAIQNNIIILAYPPHCTHALQGLDEIWKEEIRRFEEHHKHGVKKGDFTETFGKAFVQAFTPETVRSAFEKMGIHPFNPEVISPDQMKPSMQHRHRMSPVRTVMQSWRREHSTSCTPFIHLTTRLADAWFIHSSQIVTHPHTPSSATFVDTPSKRARLMSENLAKLSSGSFLISRTPLTSSQTITPPIFGKVPRLPEPNWSLLSTPLADPSKAEMQDRIKCLTESLRLVCETALEAAQAQLKLNQALHTKENKGKTDRAVLFEDRKGRHLTNREFIEGRMEEAAAKVQRANMHKTKKTETTILQERWKQLCEEHAHTRDAWEKECERLQAEGVAKKHLPKAPKKFPSGPQVDGSAAVDEAREQAGEVEEDVDKEIDGEESLESDG
ncbi:uncharacterized protein B0H18DRAFT_1092169 [Fomitopsis serialis]|uniref:uncharacterized protein n=1 Tax=Fomitopsis serialis TaxID=139415 RepID=UPI0020083D9B|nr:uncharacterized protein B0H18DRAFT_1092169 [Neoantrodia serialis]KAH9935436.1 hypothetical protein B0H18DRAFT_1092169 [Neoantrodia serialis]